MEVWWPSGAALRGEASNCLMLRWLRTVVVSDEEKAHMMRQVGAGKTTTAEASKRIQMTSKPGSVLCSGMSLAGARRLVRWCPAQRWREPCLRLSCGTWEGVSGNCRLSSGERECPSRGVPRRDVSTVAVTRWRTGP